MAAGGSETTPAVTEVSKKAHKTNTSKLTEPTPQPRDGMAVPFPQGVWLDPIFQLESSTGTRLGMTPAPGCPCLAGGIGEPGLKSQGSWCCLFPGTVLRCWKASGGVITLMH